MYPCTDGATPLPGICGWRQILRPANFVDVVQEAIETGLSSILPPAVRHHRLPPKLLPVRVNSHLQKIVFSLLLRRDRWVPGPPQASLQGPVFRGLQGPQGPPGAPPRALEFQERLQGLKGRTSRSFEGASTSRPSPTDLLQPEARTFLGVSGRWLKIGAFMVGFGIPIKGKINVLGDWGGWQGCASRCTGPGGALNVHSP